MSKGRGLSVVFLFVLVLLIEFVCSGDYTSKVFMPDENKVAFYQTGIGKISDYTLLSNTPQCSKDCSATILINLTKEGSLIDALNFFKIKGVTKKAYLLREYSIDVDGKPYDYKATPPGVYKVTIRGSKEPYETIDWVIKANDISITDWAVWGTTPGSLSFDVDLVHYYTFESATKNVDVKSGYNFTATDISLSVVGGKEGNATRGNWSGGSGNMWDSTEGTPKYLNDSTTGSFSIWINSSVGEYLEVDTIGSGTGFRLDGTPHFYCAGDLVSNTSITENVWTLITFTWDGSHKKIWLNNDLVGNASSNCNPFIGSGQIVSYGYSNDAAEIATLDEGRWYNISLTSAQITSLYSGVSTMALESPIDNYISNSSQVNFTCSFNIVGATGKNISLWHNQTGTWHMNQTNEVTGTSNETTFFLTLDEGKTLWSCSACDSDDDCTTATENRTIEVRSFPSINISRPSATETSLTIPILLNITNKTALSFCYFNITRGASTEVANTEIVNCLNTTAVLSGEATYIINTWANNSYGYFNSTSKNFTVSLGGGGGGPGGGGGGSRIIELFTVNKTKEDICKPKESPYSNAYDSFIDKPSMQTFVDLVYAWFGYVPCKSAASIIPI